MADQKNKTGQDTSATENKGPGFSGQAPSSTLAESERSFDDVRKTGTQGSSFEQNASRGSSAGTGTATARSFVDQAKETASQAVGAVTERAAETLDERKTTVTGGLTAVADSIRQVAQKVNEPGAAGMSEKNPLTEAAAKYSGTAAQKLEDVANYFDRKGVREMVHDVEGFARRNPAMFIGAAFAVGILAARFLKSSGPDNYEGTSPRRLSAPSTGMDRTTAPTTGQSTGMSSAQNTGQNTASTGTGTPSKKTNVSNFDTGGSAKKNTSTTKDSLTNPS